MIVGALLPAMGQQVPAQHLPTVAALRAVRPATPVAAFKAAAAAAIATAAPPRILPMSSGHLAA